MASNDYIFFTEWRADATPAEAYDILFDATGYLRWWPEVYLEVTTLQTAGPDGLGGQFRLLTRGKLPYKLRWEARVTEARPPHGFTIEALGDFVGRGVWALESRDDGTRIDFDWRLRAEKPLIRSLSFLFKPFFLWNHRWAMARGQEGLRRETARRRRAVAA